MKKRKSNHELQQELEEAYIFKKFLEAHDPENHQLYSVESRVTPEPDILCVLPDQTKIAFELCELCSQNIASAISRDLKTGNSTFVRTSDPSRNKFKQKLIKEYQTKYPKELLLYTNGRIVSPDDLIVFNCSQLISVSKNIQFQKIWLWGNKIHLLYNSIA